MYVYIYNIGTNILTEKYNGEIFEGGVVAKPWYFTVLAGSPPKKKPLPMLWRSPFLFPTPAVNK